MSTADTPERKSWCHPAQRSRIFGQRPENGRGLYTPRRQQRRKKTRVEGAEGAEGREGEGITQEPDSTGHGKASEGSTYAIVPYVNPAATGAVTGVVGAGGNMGAVCWGMIFLFSGMDASDCFMTIGCIVIGVSMLSPLIMVKGPYGGIFCNPRQNEGYGKS